MLFWLPIAPFGCCRQNGCRLKSVATGGPIDKVLGTTLKLQGHHIRGTWRLFPLFNFVKKLSFLLYKSISGNVCQTINLKCQNH